MMDWQPIVTLPPGEPGKFLVFVPGEGVTTAEWCGGRIVDLEMWSDDWGYDRATIAPTHWMPLPTPPVVKDKDQ